MASQADVIRRRANRILGAEGRPVRKQSEHRREAEERPGVGPSETLTPYLIGIGVYLFGRDRDFVVASIGSFWIGPALLAFIFLSAVHMDIGMRTIIEDYVHGHMRKLALLFLNSAFAWLVCLLCVFAILRMMFEAAQQ